jgi:hypothetical protein
MPQLLPFGVSKVNRGSFARADSSDPRDPQPSYRRNKLEITEARTRRRLMAADSGAGHLADPGGGAEKYVRSVVVAIRGGLLNSGTSDGPRQYVGSMIAAVPAS